ncbi:MAG: NAD(P)-dependent oxidoreductase [Anaerolineaceae bacterium]|nr:NAD(P)-dependent oxidoreductase [Anaerolineaceae bacterium]
MAAQYLMSLDLGGCGGRATLLNPENGKITVSTCAWVFSPDTAAGPYAIDLGTDSKWRALCELAREVLAKVSAGPQDVAGISVTSMRHGMVLIGKDGAVLMATPNQDARAFAESMQMQAELGEELYQRTGHYPSPVILAPRMKWVMQNRPELLKEVTAVVTISDWMAYMLSGVAVVDISQAGETCLFDLEKGDWAFDLIEALGLPIAIFPRIVFPGTKLGGLTAKAASELGLAPGIPVAVGGADTQLGLLGLGITGPNQVGVIAGSTTPVMVTTSQPKIDPEGHTWTGMYMFPKTYVTESNAGGMGTSLDWFAGLMYANSPAPVAALSGDAANSLPGASGILSTLGVHLFNAKALGLPIDGLTFSTMTTPTGLSGRSQLARAVLEGMAFSIRMNADQALKVAGVNPQEIRLGGGMTRSAAFTQMVTEVFNLPVESAYGQSTSGVGAAICAAVAAGLYPDLASAAKALVQDLHTIQPGELANTYANLYRTWSDYFTGRAAADEIAQGSIMQAMMTAPDSGSSAQVSFRPRIYVGANAGEDAIKLLRELGDVTYASYSETGNVLSGDEMVETLKGFQVLVTEVDMVDAAVLQKTKDLRVVVACRGNPVNVDIPACTAAGVPVINTPGRNADAVADLAVSFMLMLVRKLDKASAFLREPGGEAGDMGRMGQAFFTLKGNELWHKTVGIIGGGAIGRKVIHRLLPFEVSALVYDPYLTSEQAALAGATKVSFEELLAKSDLISMHAAVTEDTTGMLNDAAFALMKPGAFLVNTARAALIDYEALLRALQSGKLGGAAFDVFPVEPPGSDDPLLAFENVIATPHIGGNTDEVGIHQGMIIVDELSLLLSGKKPKYILNPSTLEGFSWSKEIKRDEATLAELAKGAGPGMTDLELKSKNETPVISEPEEKKPGGLLSGLRRLVGSKEKEIIMEPVAPVSGSKAEAEARYCQILAKFLSDLATDSAAQTFAKTNKVTFQFVLKYTEITFYMGFGDGKVTAGMGEAPFKPDVTVKLDADSFDGMFTGRLDGTAAFKSGKLSVAGNMLKAMAMQKLNFGPVYARARDGMGGAGDLTMMGPASVVTVSPSARAVAVNPAPSTIPMAVDAPNFGKFRQILERFTGLMREDAGTLAFAKGKNVTFQYVIKDTDITLYTGFVDGKVNTGMGQSPDKVDVSIKTDATTLDGMFTGRLDGAAAFKSGKLSVSGNMMKAMVMQKLNYGALYSKARAEIGDPGNLSAGAPASAPTPMPASNTATVSAGEIISMPAVIHKVGDIRDTILEVNNEMFHHGWITSTGGNISARSESNPDEIWITPSGLFKGNLTAEMMVKVDLEGNIVGDSPYSASSERRVHCNIYSIRPDVKAVVHTHALYSTLVGLTNTRWLPISADAAFFGEIPVIPFIMPGSPELGDEVARAIGQKGVAAIMQNHGLVVAGSGLRQAADTTEAIEITAEKLLYCRNVGITPAVLPADVVSILSEMSSMVA